jgi:D-sedoheptulose 7-phosphate isomerase
VSYIDTYLADIGKIAAALDRAVIDRMIEALVAVRDGGGRLFILGVGGSAGNASHAVNDFRKLAGLECYAPTDNVSELTARTNDEGWATVFAEWLKTSRIGPRDAVLVFSVGGGSREKNVSANLVEAIDAAKAAGAKVLGVVGRDGGYTKRVGDAVLVIPVVDPGSVTPHAESFQAVVWHLLVSDPRLMRKANKWESTR